MSTPPRHVEPARLSTGELLGMLQEAVLVDAHGPAYFAAGHISGAVNIPPHEVRRLAPVRIAARDARVVVYGSSGSSNAAIVADLLVALGYEQVSVYRDGLDGWIAAGLPVEALPEDETPLSDP